SSDVCSSDLASITAEISSKVILSSRMVFTLNKRNSILAIALMNHAKGLQTLMKIWMGSMTETAIFSGAIMARRFGIRSANKINNEVTTVKESAKLIFSAQGPW